MGAFSNGRTGRDTRPRYRYIIFVPTILLTAACGSPEPTEATPQMWPMPTPPGAGLPNERAYELQSSEVAFDAITELSWQRSLDPVFFTWEEAQSYCTGLDLGGFDDWRLPSRIELVSILSLNAIDPAIDTDVFPNTPSDWFWSNTESGADEAWYVYFYFGYPNTDRKTSAFSVRCVRSEVNAQHALDPTRRYEPHEDIVHDWWTGLTWQRQQSARSYTFAEATRYCTELTLDGRKWRAPTMPELQTIVDVTQAGAAIDPLAFPGATASPLWSSSPWVEAPELRGWYVDFATGAALYLIGTTPYPVRCVAAADVP